MRKGKIVTLFLIVSVCILSACSGGKVPETITENAVVIDKEGNISEYIVDTFDKAFYSLSELENMVREEAVSYNDANQLAGDKVPVQVLKVEALENQPSKVLVNRLYDRAETYSKNSGEEFFFGTVASARVQLEKIGSSQDVKNVKKGDSLKVLQLITMSEKHVVITTAKTVVYCPYAVEYISDGLTVREDGSVDTTNMAENTTAIIVLKK